jgi:putative ABC transport system permease protein
MDEIVPALDRVDRYSPGFSAFVVAGLSIIFITLLTVSLQAINAAVSNPVKSLKAE